MGARPLGAQGLGESFTLSSPCASPVPPPPRADLGPLETRLSWRLREILGKVKRSTSIFSIIRFPFLRFLMLVFFRRYSTPGRALFCETRPHPEVLITGRDLTENSLILSNFFKKKLGGKGTGAALEKATSEPSGPRAISLPRRDEWSAFPRPGSGRRPHLPWRGAMRHSALY